MNKMETIKLMAILKTAYPKFFINQDKNEVTLQIDLWTELLSDVPFQIVEIAVKKLILESPFPPAISDIRKRIAEITRPENEVTAADAWGEVNKAIRNFGFYRESEALESMSPLTKRAVKAIGWQDICTCEEPDVIRGQFRRAYEQVLTKEKQEALLPDNLKAEINMLSASKNIKMLE